MPCIQFCAFEFNLSGRIKIMSKREMRKQGIKSPNAMDATMLTFIEGEEILEKSSRKEKDEFEDDESNDFLYPSMNL